MAVTLLVPIRIMTAQHASAMHAIAGNFTCGFCTLAISMARMTCQAMMLSFWPTAFSHEVTMHNQSMAMQGGRTLRSAAGNSRTLNRWAQSLSPAQQKLRRLVQQCAMYDMYRGA